MAEEYVDPRAYGTQLLDYLMDNTSPSEFRGAHDSIDKLISNADPKAEYAKLFDIEYGTNKMGFYRHLDQADSTVTILNAIINSLAPSMHSDDERLLAEAKRVQGNPNYEPSTIIDAARALAEKRNR